MRKKLTIPAIFAYGAELLFGLFLAVGLIISFASTVSGDLSGGALAFAVVFMIILALLYISLSFFPLLFKYLYYKNRRTGFTVACLPFDAVQLILSIIVFVFAIKSADPLGIIFTLALLFTVICALALNIVTLVIQKLILG